MLLELHEKVILSALLTNTEAWTLGKGDKDEIERIEIQTLKMLFDLPIHTPTPAIIFSLGTLYTSLRIEKKRLMYLHRTIRKHDSSWPKKTLLILNQLNLGWAKSINETLNDLDLPTDFSTIKEMTKRQWKRIVDAKIEVQNQNRLISECYKTDNNTKIRKTKTAHITDIIEGSTYIRGPTTELLYCDKLETKTLIIARFGMLQCGKNYKGTMSETCNYCNVIDDENHRLNDCPLLRNVNLADTRCRIDFNDVFSSDINVLRPVIKEIGKVWNVQTAHGTMNK